MPIWRQRCQICPFFVRESELTITCEGMAVGAECVQRFSAADGKRAHQTRYCESFQFKKCPWAAMLEKEAEEGITGEKTIYMTCSLPGEPCPCSLPRKGMCCACCDLKRGCPAPHMRCENSPQRCGFSRSSQSSEAGPPVGREMEVREDVGAIGTLFDFL